MFEWIGQHAPVGVADLEGHFGLNHTTVRQHLRRLVEAGLLLEETAPPGRPGRPRLVYRVAPGVEGTWHHDGPYERLGLLLLEMLETSRTAREVGAIEGRRLAARGPARTGDAATAIEDRLAVEGFAPRRDERFSDTELVMERCPFEAAATASPAVVCDLHRGLAEGMAEALGDVVVVDLVARPPQRAGCRLQLQLPAEAPGRASRPDPAASRRR
jgi:predicted ArsR family transcriptional regulator